MRNRRKIWGGLCLLVVYAVLVIPAHAELSGDFEKFQPCPWTNPQVEKCIHAVTRGGEVVLGSRTVPIENPVLIQGGIGIAKAGAKFSDFVGATDGITMAKVAQNVPGGLLGIVPKSPSSAIVRTLVAALFENSLLSLQATPELAGPAEEIGINPGNLNPAVSGVVLRLPVKVHLESPILGPKCFVGSASHPIIWDLGIGKTSPSGPNKPIEGALGKGLFLAEGLIYRLAENKLVDNAWGTPKASGCGGPLSFLVNPMVNAGLGNTAAGHNTAILESEIELVAAAGLKLAEEESP